MNDSCSLAARFVAALAVATALAPAAAEDAAMLIDVRAGTVQSAGKPIAILAGLNAGARLELDGGARATVAHYAAGRHFDLDGPGSFLLTAGGIEAGGGGRVTPRAPLAAAFRDVRLRPARTAQASITMRAAADAAAPEPISPVGAWILQPNPTLQWAMAPGAQVYRVRLTDAAGRVLHEASTAATSANLPASVTLTIGQSYNWQVETILPGGRRVEAWAEFSLADAERRALFESARPGPGASFGERMLFAQLLDEAGLPDAARAALEELGLERPADPRLQALRKAR